MVVALGVSVQGAQVDRTRVAPNPLMGALTGAPTEGRLKAALPPLPPEAHPDEHPCLRSSVMLSRVTHYYPHTPR